MLVNRAALEGIFTSFSAIFNQSLEATQTMWEQIATRVPSTGAKNDYKWLGAMPKLREWIGERFVQSLEAFNYEVANKDFESTVSVDRNDIEDDQLGVYRPLIQALAQSARMHPEELIFDLLAAGLTSLCFDGKAFFATDHPVGDGTDSNYDSGSAAAWYLLDTTKFIKPLLFQDRKAPQFVALDTPENDNVFLRKQYVYGVDYRGNVGYTFWQLAFCSKLTLNATNYAAARKQMLEFKNEYDKSLNIMPNLLVVGPSNEGPAKEVLETDRNAAGATNIWRNTAKVMVSPRLS